MIKTEDLIALVDACIDDGMGLVGEIVKEIRRIEYCDVRFGVDQACYALSKIEGKNKEQAQKILNTWRAR